MKHNCTRLLSLLLVVVLVIGMFPAAMAAEIGESSGDTEALTEAWQQISDSLPDAITGYDPNDPDNAYPYGVPVDNFYPEGLLDLNPYAISTMAASSQGSIPDEMWDNAILRALEYTGYNVQRQKDRGQLYSAQYIGSALKNNDPSVLSDIGYWSSGACPNGDETVADSSTVTGRAPKISYFESNGLVCASFVTYYLCNYLPNIEGVDTSVVYEKAKELGADSRYDNVYYLTSVSLWKRTLDALASQGDAGVTKYTNASTAYENLVPGDVIIFSSDGDLKHVAIYAGTYDLYSYGSSLGKYHFIIHVGNSRGPEISTVEYMGSAGAKSSYPTAWYHLDFNDTVESTGFIEINKTDPSDQPLSGAYFVATNQSTQEKYVIGPTNSKGYAKSGELPLGTYVVKETVFPDGYTSSGETSWTVTLTEDTPNMTVTINAVNKLITGKAKIVKTTTNGGTKSGWHFEVKDSSGTVIGNYVTDSTGIITLDLEPGTYTVTETDGPQKYWVNDPDPTRTITVKADQTATVTFTNQWRGQAQIVKTATNGGSVAGWHFEVKDSTGNLVGSFVTDSTGIITIDLEPGTYTVTETDGEYEYWHNDPTPTRTVTVKAGETAKVTFQNQWVGKAKIVKTTTNGGTVEGWEFTITDSSGAKVGTYVTDASGTILVDLEPGTYTVQETDRNDPYWYCDTDPQTVTVKAGETATVTFRNQWIGKAKVIKTLANPEAGTVEGWTFTITDANGNEIGSYQTDSEGIILADLEPGIYTVTEVLEENSLWACTAANPQTITVAAGQTAEVTFENALRPGEIRIQKVDTKGEPLEGVEFLLEWSVDGENWSPVTYTDSTVPQIGGCTTEGLTDGKLVTDTDGLATFSGLYPTLQYRLTETATQDGYQLLADYAYVGGLSVENDLTVTLKVVNAEAFTLPKTGSKSLVLMPLSILLCLGICAGAIVYLHKKED